MSESPQQPTSSDPLEQAQQEGPQIPPTPRLQAGHLLPGDLEVVELLFSHQGKNIYRTRDGSISYLLLECFDQEEEDQPGHPSLIIDALGRPHTFRCNGRAYALFPDEQGVSLREFQLPCIERELVMFLLILMESLTTLHELGIDLSHFQPEDVMILDDRPCFLCYPWQARKEVAIESLLVSLVVHVLFKTVLPKATRNLDSPLTCLALSKQMEEACQAFLKSHELSPWLDWLRCRAEAEEPYWDLQAATSVGHVREHNEDAMTWQMRQIHSHRLAQELVLLGVSDGMGGHSKGEEASHLALTHFMAHLNRHLVRVREITNPQFNQLVAAAFDHAATSVRHSFEDQNFSHPPGATLVAGMVLDRDLYLGNCGDSRAYLFTEDGLQQITVDHSLLQLYVERGLITAGDTLECDSHVITTFMGIEERSFKRDVYSIHLPVGATLMLCSDGLTDMVRPHKIEQILRAANSSREAVSDLINIALDHGGHDNVTVLVLKDRTQPQPREAELPQGEVDGDTK